MPTCLARAEPRTCRRTGKRLGFVIDHERLSIDLAAGQRGQVKTSVPSSFELRRALIRRSGASRCWRPSLHTCPAGRFQAGFTSVHNEDRVGGVPCRQPDRPPAAHVHRRDPEAAHRGLPAGEHTSVDWLYDQHPAGTPQPSAPPPRGGVPTTGGATRGFVGTNARHQRRLRTRGHARQLPRSSDNGLSYPRWAGDATCAMLWVMRPPRAHEFRTACHEPHMNEPSDPSGAAWRGARRAASPRRWTARRHSPAARIPERH